MSDDDTDDRDVLLPRENFALFGHADAERALLESYQSGRIPHAWLIGGPPGIGKATLAYRLARFVLAHPDRSRLVVQKATSLAVEPDDPVARRIAAQAQGDLLVLERTVNEQTGKTLHRDPRRRRAPLGRLLRLDRGRGRLAHRHRRCRRRPCSAKAPMPCSRCWKSPPARTLLLLISHAPGRELPTIRSRCRRLLLRPLPPDDVARAIAVATGRDADDAEVKKAAAAADGSVARAPALLDGPALALRQRVLDLFAQLPNPDPRALPRARRFPGRQRTTDGSQLSWTW